MRPPLLPIELGQQAQPPRLRRRQDDEDFLRELPASMRGLGEAFLDVGSGAGLPGIPRALVHPQRRVTLLEASHKKSAFLQQAVIELGLRNATVVRERVETFEPGHRYDVVISRAFSDLAEFIALAGRHVRDGGTLAAMKGVYPHEELGQLPGGFRLSGTDGIS